jgi:hypothetical protein
VRYCQIANADRAEIGHSVDEGNAQDVVAGHHTRHDPCLFFKGLPALAGSPEGSIVFISPHQLHGIGLNSETGHSRRNYQIEEVCGRVEQVFHVFAGLSVANVATTLAECFHILV